jgi:plasmid stabilization system protein ParE
MVKVIWTESAIQDLDDIGEYIAKDSVRYAELTVANVNGNYKCRVFSK